MRYLRPLACILLILALLPVPARADAAPEMSGKVTASSLNMRISTSTSATVLTQARKGDVVNILFPINVDEQLWYKVHHRGEIGYMSAEYVEVMEAGSAEAAAASAEVSAAPSAPPATLQVGTVTSNSLRMRKTASTSAQVLLTLTKNTQLTVLSPEITEADGHQWLQVNHGGKDGYISSEYVSLDDSASFSAGTGTVTGSVVNLRSEPTTGSVVVRKLAEGASVKVTGVESGWYKVSYNDKTGYIHPDYLTLVPPPAPRVSSSSSTSSVRSDTFTISGGGTTSASTQQCRKIGTAALDKSNPSATERKVVETALKYLGARYAYGASNGKTFDCSGFTSWVMKELGYSINRSASDQYTRNGRTVSKSELRPGDLVFFADRRVSRKIVSHVGIYIGDGYFVHAGSTNNGAGRCVKVSSMTQGHYAGIYKGAKRVA
jgi:cell wall-associated NlpC family hydrolase